MTRLDKALVTMTVALLSNVAYADYYFHHWENQRETPGTFRLAPELLYYSSNTNYDPTGNAAPVVGLEKYQRLQTDVAVAYGFNPYLSAFARLSWARVEIQNATAPGNSFGPGDQSFGATIHLLGPKPGDLATFFDGIALDVQAQFDVPTYDNTQSAVKGTPALGDGSFDMTFGAFATLPIAHTKSATWLVVGGGGYTHRSASFSAAVPWSVTGKYVSSGEGVNFSLSAMGFQSLRNDPYAAQGGIGRGTLAGGSAAVNAVNPSLFVLRAQAGYALNRKIGFWAAATQPMYGQAAPKGFAISFGMQARWDPSTGKNAAAISPEEYGKSNQGFVNYVGEGKVSQVSERLNLIRIDKGAQDGIEVGQVFDIFSVKNNGTIGEAVARARCTQVTPIDASLVITETFKEVWIEEGFIVKRPIQ